MMTGFLFIWNFRLTIKVLGYWTDLLNTAHPICPIRPIRLTQSYPILLNYPILPNLTHSTLYFPNALNLALKMNANNDENKNPILIYFFRLHLIHHLRGNSRKMNWLAELSMGEFLFECYKIFHSSHRFSSGYERYN